MSRIQGNGINYKLNTRKTFRRNWNARKGSPGRDLAIESIHGREKGRTPFAIRWVGMLDLGLPSYPHMEGNQAQITYTYS